MSFSLRRLRRATHADRRQVGAKFAPSPPRRAETGVDRSVGSRIPAGCRAPCVLAGDRARARGAAVNRAWRAGQARKSFLVRSLARAPRELRQRVGRGPRFTATLAFLRSAGVDSRPARARVTRKRNSRPRRRRSSACLPESSRSASRPEGSEACATVETYFLFTMQSLACRDVDIAVAS
jgi:hypothetical protein